MKSWISNKFNWSFISSINDLQHGDALVLSVPFCDTGNELQHLEKILLHCEKLSIPVLIDCCYYSISAGINYNFVYNCIDTITFSLSKTFPVSNLRIGVRYTRKDIVDGQTLHSDINYNHSWSAWIGYSLMQKFSPDFIYDTYKDQQNEICDFFNLKPSQSVIFACGAESWSTYNRSTMLKEYQLMFDPNLFNNRICLNTFYENWDLFTKFRMLVCR